MPSIVTHYLFSEEVKNKSSKNIQENLNKAKEIYNIFAQSFDNFFYYNLLTPKKGKEIRKFGNLAQRENINLYFKNIILEIKKKKLQKNPEILAYLYGSLTHYILDSNCHPFVIFHAGWIDEEHPNYKYRGNHEKIEVNIDAILYQEKTGNPLFKAKLGNTLLPKIKFSPLLIDTLNHVFKNTWNQENLGKIYEKSTLQGHYILKYLVTDHHGMKKSSYKLFDLIFSKNKTKYQNLSFYIKNPKIEIMNRKHELWSNPVDNTLTSFESFDDLYQKAIKETLKIFDLTEKVLNETINLENYLQILGNKSYTTGLDWNKKEKFQYFKN